ncbi:cobalamin B12-binding domain-containing protein [Methylorubrum salsuginis]|uniref:Methanogenic corrinoid protein MtbC1 n=1 Tax=Methylorubrum salsuginis TaxID=414703 RepID=A0A1I4GLP1_9HYPH|nr:cobalamin B12-binding domain-containing protein [Methylorubrum salsuginis]SFL30277.1 Methanogenic corrinoid protein MtbC1 [Methylorubrum salsuginis]
MGGWRHFGERLEVPSAARECGVAEETLPASAFDIQPDAERMRRRLAGVVEAEILPRLMLVHRGRMAPSPATQDRQPSPDDIARLCDLLLSRTDGDLTLHLLRFLDEGLSLESVLVELLTPAARHIGRLWEDDACDFIEVTVALGRLQAVARDLCARYGDDHVEPRGRSILMLPCPGETHVFCLAVLAGIFRESGWDVTTAGQEAGVDPAELVAGEWFDVVGLTLSCDVLFPRLSQTIAALRQASRNPSLRILVGGPYFVRHPDHVSVVGADATAEDGRLAPLISESLLEMRSRAC